MRNHSTITDEPRARKIRRSKVTAVDLIADESINRSESLLLNWWIICKQWWERATVRSIGTGSWKPKATSSSLLPWKIRIPLQTSDLLRWWSECTYLVRSYPNPNRTERPYGCKIWDWLGSHVRYGTGVWDMQKWVSDLWQQNNNSLSRL